MFLILLMVAVSVASLGFVGAIIRAADRRTFPSAYVMPRAPKVLVVVDDYSPLDWKGLV